jgi:hypothetical protein
MNNLPMIMMQETIERLSLMFVSYCLSTRSMCSSRLLKSTMKNERTNEKKTTTTTSIHRNSVLRMRRHLLTSTIENETNLFEPISE